MSILNRRALAALVPMTGLALCTATAELCASSMPSPLPIDRPAKIAGVTVACTGVGFGEEREARWKAYPAKFEAVDSHGQYLGDENLTLRNRARDQLMRVSCDAPWLMLNLRPGHYTGTMTALNTTARATRHISFSVPASGQRDVIVRFAGVDQRVGRAG